MKIPQMLCEECRYLSEGEVVKGHDHRTPNNWQLQAAIYILAEAIQDEQITGITKDIDNYLGEFPKQLREIKTTIII